MIKAMRVFAHSKCILLNKYECYLGVYVLSLFVI
nr:MAG TPA: hypothetical protein [Caudoviricetes sp.]